MTQTVTTLLRRRDPGPRRVGRLMIAVGMCGVLAGVAAVAVGLWLLTDLQDLLGRSLGLSAQSLTAVDSSLAVATESVTVVQEGLGDAEITSRGLQGSLTEGAALLEETARLTRNDVAASLESVERSMPALIQVGGTIDTTLRTVDQLPLGADYSPQEPFDVTLRALQEDLAGLPDDLREQADAIAAAGGTLRKVGGQSVAVADSISEVRSSLDDAGRVLGEYQTTASDARGLLDQTEADLARRLLVVRVLVVVLGLIYCAGQVLPMYLGYRLTEVFGNAQLDVDR